MRLLGQQQRRAVMQEQDKSQAPPAAAPSESPGCEQVAIPEVGDLLEEMESALASSRRDDALRQEREQRLRYLVSTEVYREDRAEEERRYRYRQEMQYREAGERSRRMYSDLRNYPERPRCNIDCKCGPCRDGECQDCTKEGGNRFVRRDADMGRPGAEPWRNF